MNFKRAATLWRWASPASRSALFGYRMNKKTEKNIDRYKKPALQHIINPFLKLMQWVGKARKSNMVCNG